MDDTLDCLDLIPARITFADFGPTAIAMLPKRESAHGCRNSVNVPMEQTACSGVKLVPVEGNLVPSTEGGRFGLHYGERIDG